MKTEQKDISWGEHHERLANAIRANIELAADHGELKDWLSTRVSGYTANGEWLLRYAEPHSCPVVLSTQWVIVCSTTSKPFSASTRNALEALVGRNLN